MERRGAPPWTTPVPAVVTTKEEALALMDRTFETCDQSLFAPMVRAMTDAEDAVVFGIMRGSENEMDLFGKAMDLLRERGITQLAGLAGLHRPGDGDPNRRSSLTADGPPERSRRPGAQPMNVQMKPPVRPRSSSVGAKPLRTQ